MKYQKPEVVAKSAAKESFVAGCPTQTSSGYGCGSVNRNCELVAAS